MIRKKILLCIVLTAIITIGTTFVRHHFLKQDFWISFCIYFVLVFFLIVRSPEYKKAILLSFLSTIIGLYGLAWIIDGQPPLLGLTNIIGTLIACTSGYAFYVFKSTGYRLSIISVCVFICIFYVAYGHKFWLNYLNYGTPTGRMAKKTEVNWVYDINDSSGTFKKSVQNNNLIVLDFFNTACPVCFAKFPILQKIYNQYKDNSNIAIYAINIPIKRDSIGMAVNMVKRKNYTFPVMVGKYKLDSIFDIRSYPTTILIRNDTIIFKGGIEDAYKKIEEVINK